MICEVTRAFAYAHDGVAPVRHAAGEKIEVRDDLVPGLTAAGYLFDPADPARIRVRQSKPFGDTTAPELEPVEAPPSAAEPRAPEPKAPKGK